MLPSKLNDSNGSRGFQINVAWDITFVITRRYLQCGGRRMSIELFQTQGGCNWQFSIYERGITLRSIQHCVRRRVPVRAQDGAQHMIPILVSRELLMSCETRAYRSPSPDVGRPLTALQVTFQTARCIAG